jgi:hypothetical protein
MTRFSSLFLTQLIGKKKIWTKMEGHLEMFKARYLDNE